MGRVARRESSGSFVLTGTGGTVGGRVIKVADAWPSVQYVLVTYSVNSLAMTLHKRCIAMLVPKRGTVRNMRNEVKSYS